LDADIPPVPGRRPSEPPLLEIPPYWTFPTPFNGFDPLPGMSEPMILTTEPGETDASGMAEWWGRPRLYSEMIMPPIDGELISFIDFVDWRLSFQIPILYATADLADASTMTTVAYGSYLRGTGVAGLVAATAINAAADTTVPEPAAALLMLAAAAAMLSARPRRRA
jgi:hypothetical protein